MSAFSPSTFGALRSKLAPANNAIGLIGHSMLDQALQLSLGGTTTGKVFSLRQAPTWVKLLSGNAVKFPEDCKFAYSGVTSTSMVQTPIAANQGTNQPWAIGLTQLDAAVMCRARVIVIHCYHNDPSNNVSLTQSIANHTLAIRKLAAAGKFVVLATDLPSGNMDFTTTRYFGPGASGGQGSTYGLGLKDAQAFRRWCLSEAPLLAPGRVAVADYWKAMIDPTAGFSTVTASGNFAGSSGVNGDILRNTAQDGVHTNALGGYLCAQVLLAAIKSFGLATYNDPGATLGDLYDATHNPRGNLLTSPVLLESGSAMTLTGVTCTGNRPTGYSLFGNGSATSGTLTAASSFVTTATGHWWQLRISGTVGGTPNTGSSGLLFFQPGFNNAPIVAGDKIALTCDVEIDHLSNGAPMTGLIAVDSFLARSWNDGTARIDQSYVLTGDIGSGDTSSSRGSGVLDKVMAARGAPLAFTFPTDYPITSGGYGVNGETILDYIRIMMPPGRAVDFTVRFQNPGMFRMP